MPAKEAACIEERQFCMRWDATNRKSRPCSCRCTVRGRGRVRLSCHKLLDTHTAPHRPGLGKKRWGTKVPP
eukprot:1162008-Pelagomonas_calceolata.AAC.7